MFSESESLDLSQKWAKFIRKSIGERLSPAQFDEFARLLVRKGEISGHEVCYLVLKNEIGRGAIDPLVVEYLKCLLHLRVILAYELLNVLLTCSYTRRNTTKASSESGPQVQLPRKHVSFEFESAILTSLILRCIAQEFPKSSEETSKTLTCLSNWMNCFQVNNHEFVMGDDPQAFQGLNTQTAVARDAVGRLVVALVESPQVHDDLNSKIPQDVLKQFGKALQSFTIAFGAVSMPLANRLEMFYQSQEALHPIISAHQRAAESNDNPEIRELQIENMPDRPITHTRANLVVVLDSLLCDLPQINDNLLLADLQSCFKGDCESMITSLIVAGFDMLAISSARGDSSDRMFLYRAFLINKVPLLMTNVSNMNFQSFVPLNLPVLMSQAFGRMESHNLASVDSGLDMQTDNELISAAKKDFLIACGLNGLISDRDVKQLADDDAIKTLPASGRADRNTLMEECRNNPTKLEQIVKDLETSNGDAGELVATLVQNLQDLCSSRDSMTLSTICLLLCTRPHAIDMIFLFNDPGPVLGPLSEMLDEWKYDDHQGEYQPVYQEFSACLLFLLACIHRYKLDGSHLQVPAPDKFVSWLLDLNVQSKPIKQLNEEQSKQLAGWAKSLFELEAISDDVMSICPPQDFYKLVPKIFQQSFLARRLDVLSVKALESGTELLLEPFLLPCMIPGINYLSEYVWMNRSQAVIVLPFLTKLIEPSTKSGESITLHNSVLSMLKPNLHGILRTLRAADATKQKQFDQLLDHLGKIEKYSRLSNTLLQAFSGSEFEKGSTALSYYRSTFDALCSWSMPGSLIASMPTYSHRDVQAVLRLCGAPKVLGATIEALIAFAETGIVDIALDIATAIITAEAISKKELGLSMYPAEVSLRRALRSAREDVAKLLQKEPVRAELIVLLHRRVEAQLSEIADTEARQITMNNVGLAMNMNAGTTDVNLDIAMNMDMDMDVINMDAINVNNQNDGQMSAVPDQNISGIDFATNSEPLNLSEGGLDLGLGGSLDGLDGTSGGIMGDNEGGDDDAARRASEDIWSGLNFNTDDLEFFND